MPLPLLTNMMKHFMYLLGRREKARNKGWKLELPTAKGKVYKTTTIQILRQLKTACYLVYENRRRTCTATSTLTKIFVWPMECGVNYHKLIKGTAREWMSFVLPVLDTTAASQGHYSRGFSCLFLEGELVSKMFLSTQVFILLF